jgi:cysteine desulfurase
MRSGTEAMPLIAAFAEAARLGKEAMQDACPRMEALRSRCIETLTSAMPDTVIIGGGAPHILSVGIPGGRSEVFINVLEQEGIFVSNSSACKRGRRSHVLEAMGIPPKAIDGALRISFSRYTTEEDADAFCQALIRARQRYFPKR